MPMDAGYADAFPLARSGGLFLAIVGAAIVAGAARFRSRNRLLAAGAAVAALATALLARRLTAPYGAPGGEQLAWLAGALAFEGALIPVAIRRYAPRGERAVTLAVLAVVGLHFLPMAPAFGPIVAVLGLFAMANAWLGVRLPAYRLPSVWAMDGAAKLAAGLALFGSHQL